MKRILFAVALVVTMMLAATLGVSAQTGSWVSGIMIQNQNPDQAANITITFYWAEGTALAGQEALSVNDTIPAGGSKAYYVPSAFPTLPDDFVGSAVVSSDQPVAANLNTQLPTGAGSTQDQPNRMGTTSGVLNPSDTLYFTQVMKQYSGWNSYVAVQNTSGSEASATITYYNDANGSPVTAATQTVSISPYSTYIFRQEENANLPTQWGGSAVVEGNQPLAGVANFYNAGTSVQTASFQSYNAFSAGATKLYVPRLVRNYYDYQGGLKIQNVGDAATDVTINYFFGANTYTQTIPALQPGAAAGLYMPNVAVLQAANVAGSGGAIITSSAEPIVATVNEDNRNTGYGVTYNAIPDNVPTTSVLFPQVTSRYYGFSGGVQIQNVGTASATVNVTFSMAGHTDVTKTVTVPANASASWFAPNEVPYKSFNGSVVVTADQPIVGIANMSQRIDRDPADNWSVNYGDSYTTYNGINK